MRAPLRWALAVAGALTLTASSCSSNSSSGHSAITHTGGTLRLAVVGLNTLDPARLVPTNLADMVAVNLLDRGLTAIDPAHNQAVPALATRWVSNAPAAPAPQATTGSTGTTVPAPTTVGTTWTFTIDPHARFADGSAVTPSDIITSLTAVARTGNSTLAGARLDVIEGYADLVAGKSTTLKGLAAGDGTLRITTTAPDAELPQLLASPVYAVVKAGHELAAPRATGTTAAGSTTTLALDAPQGSGPFKLAADDGRTLRLVRSAGSVAELDEVDLTREPTDAAALAAVRAGQADWAEVPPAQKARATGGSIGYTIQAPLGAEEFFGINLASPTFANPLFRRAIIVAVDRHAVVSGVLPGLVPSAGVVPAGVPGTVADPCGPNCAYSVAVSKALVAQAYPNGGVPLVEIDTDDDPADVSLANTVGYELAQAGIPMKVVPQPFATYQSFITTGRQQLFRTGWVGLWPSAGAYLSPLFRSTSLDNSTAFKSAEVDAQLRAAQAYAPESQRLLMYENLQRTIAADYAVVPLASYQQVLALAGRVHDYSPRLDGTFDVNRVEVKATSGTTGTTGS